MPTVNGAIWRECREEMQLTSDQAAQLLGITGGALRQIELNKKPASGLLASRASHLYRIPRCDLLRAEDAPKEEPKKPAPKKPEPKVEPTAPPRRKNGKGPGRNSARGAA